MSGETLLAEVERVAKALEIPAALSQQLLDTVVELVAPLGVPVEAGEVEVALVGKVLGDEKHLGSHGLQLCGEAPQETVVHIRRMRGVEAEAVHGVLLQRPVAD